MKCAIIKDLLPIYCDGLASDETREEVEKHIAECGDCKSVYENMKSAVPEIPKPDIQPMRKVRKSLRLRLALIVMIITAGVLTGAYQLLCAHPMLAKSDKITVSHYSRLNDEVMYVYISTLPDKHGQTCTASVPRGAKVEIDKENDCVWVDGKMLVGAEINGTEYYVPANGKLVPAGILCVSIRCDTPFKAVKYEYEQYPTLNNLLPAECHLGLRPCLPFRQDMNKCLEGDTFRQEFQASQLERGAKLTIDCLDDDIVIDLHELAVDEGLLEE